MHRANLCLLAASALAVAAPATAELIRIEIEARGELAAAGLPPYEKLSGTLHFAVDPANEANRRVADIDLAPRNADGRVEWSADFYLLRPAASSAQNGALLFEVANRGRKGLLGMFNHGGAAADPAPADVGDGFLLREGYTLLWVGWQHDVPDDSGLVRVHPPRATNGGRELRGIVRSDFVVTERSFSRPLGDRGHVAYPAIDPDGGRHSLTVRDGVLGERELIARAEWRFARQDGGRVVADPTHVYLAGGFEPFRIYEVVYESADPPLAGLGLAAIRDAVTALKHEGAPELGLPQGSLSRAIGFGLSQSGRLLRTFLYDGFNADERGRRVFDGLFVHLAGGARGSFNHRFAQPSRASWSYLYPNDIFPFSDLPQRDPATGVEDGLLSRVTDASLPRILYTDTSNEYWRGSAALTHVAVDGKQDLAPPDNVRRFLLAGTQHVPSGFPPSKGAGRELANPNDYRWFLKALLVRLDQWIAGENDMPESRYPRLAHGTLTPLAELRFPAVPGTPVPAELHGPLRLDFGARFATERIIAEPPRAGAAFPLLVPQVNSDGNETAGLISPELAVPLASYTGWSLYDPAVGPGDRLVSLQGSYLPFAATRADRDATGDPRPSIAERYAGRDDYVARVREHTQELIAAGLLLAEDAAAIEQAAGRHWDRRMP